MQNTNPWRTLSSRIAYENAWLHIREDQVIRPDGQPGIYGVVVIRPSVGIIAINERDEVALVRQWRYTTGTESVEIPRGGSSPGETDLEQAARRELREECGYEAASWEPLGAMEVCNGVTTDVQHFYIARGLTFVGAEQEPEEQIATEWVPVDDAVALAVGGGITEVCSVAALLRYNCRHRSTPSRKKP